MRANGIPVGDLKAGINLSATWAESAKQLPKWQNNTKNTDLVKTLAKTA